MYTTVNNAYISNNIEFTLKKKFVVEDDGNCDVTEMSNLKFYKCVKSDNFNKKYYYIGTYTNNSHGYDSVEQLTTDRKCFNTLRDSFRKDAISKEVKIKGYTFNRLQESNNKFKWVYDKQGYDKD